MLTVKRPKTIDDLMRLPPETRAELIEGEIFMSPAPHPKHQMAIGNIFRGVENQAREGGWGRVFVAPVDVVLEDEVVEPDVLFIATSRLGIVRDRIEGAPDLVVEVLSPSTEVRDRVVKRALYAKNGIREYWIVDVDAKSVEVLKLAGTAYGLHAVFEAGDRITSPVLPGLSLPVADVFA